MGHAFSHMPDIRNSSSSLAGIRAALLFSLTFWKSSTTPQVCTQADAFCSKSKHETHMLSHFFGGHVVGRNTVGILVPQPGIEPGPSAVKVQSPNHQTARKFPHFLPNVHFLMGKRKAVIGRTFLTYVAC